MAIIKLAKNDPIIQRAEAIDTSELTEVGFIPGDEYGCKIYARKNRGRTTIVGIHSRSYGCKRERYMDAVLIK